VVREELMGSRSRSLGRRVRAVRWPRPPPSLAAVGDPAIGAAFASIVAAAARGPAARGILSRFIDGRAATMSVLISRAAHRGEVPADTDAAEVVKTVTAQLYYRLRRRRCRARGAS
jgi:Tetracyclin repressor-like, C-terminal domain